MSRVAIVTGGTRGIGEAISLALKEMGYAVAANYAGNEEKAKAFTVENALTSRAVGSVSSTSSSSTSVARGPGSLLRRFANRPGRKPPVYRASAISRVGLSKKPIPYLPAVTRRRSGQNFEIEQKKSSLLITCRNAANIARLMLGTEHKPALFAAGRMILRPPPHTHTR